MLINVVLRSIFRLIKQAWEVQFIVCLPKTPLEVLQVMLEDQQGILFIFIW